MGKVIPVGDRLIIRGARQHNLKNVNLELPRNQLIVFTGLSGSGKSSLAFDTIYAEGQRRYVESLSAYARQFLGQMDKPDVDLIEGLSPAISIDQKTTSHNPRSTVGTVTEIYDYLRLLYARIGSPHCHQCGRPIESQTVDQIVDQIMLLPGGTRIQVLAPIIRGRKGEHKSIFEQVRKDGYVRVRVDGEIKDVNEDIELDKYKIHDIEVVVDRIIIKDGIESRLADSLDTALRAGNGVVLIDVIGQESLLFSEKLACIQCGISVEELSPRMFSFNGPYGACPVCDGLGTRMEIDPDLVLDKERSINEGGIIPWANRNSKWLDAIVASLCSEYDIDRDLPLGQLEPKKLDVLLFGTRGREVSFSYTNMRNQTRTHQVAFRGVVGHLEEYLRENGTDAIPEYVSPYMQQRPCNTCKGKRLKPESLAVTVGGESIATVVDYSITQAVQFFRELSLTERQQQIARQILKEIQARLNFLVDVGLGYLTLSRSAGSLSGGEAQRIRLATQIGSGLVGVLYILDEPSIGLHQRDNQRLISTLKGLRELGNTVIVVEHDEDTIRSADWIV
ncbi:MAG: excinuclease ABC subunit UvrA, partial [Limnochordia bacterium]|nr:excinuclease ABC subunit UvrA [Limnochordia bacterium]